MKIIVGLGNPGKKYDNTRHNIGFQLLDVIANKKGLEFNKENFNAKYCECLISGEKVLLVKPMSYMNLSGGVVAKFVSFFKVDVTDILIIQDDLDMGMGRVKIVHNSSSGGHNGIKDIERCLGSNSYARVKIGISNNKNQDTKDYVLGKFSDDEINILKNEFEILSGIVDDFCLYSLDKLMSKYNHK